MNNWKSALLMTLNEYKQNKYTCTEFSSVKYPTNKISSVNFFNNHKKHLSQTNKLFRIILKFSFFITFVFLCQLTFISDKTNLFEVVWIKRTGGSFSFLSITIPTKGSEKMNRIFSQLVFHFYFVLLDFNNKRINQKILIHVLPVF